jgi:hypothetical protein
MPAVTLIHPAPETQGASSRVLARG